MKHLNLKLFLAPQSAAEPNFAPGFEMVLGFYWNTNPLLDQPNPLNGFPEAQGREETTETRQGGDSSRWLQELHHSFFLGWEPRGTGSPVLFPGWHSQIPCRLPTGPCPWWRAAPRPSEPARRWSAPSRCLPPAQCLQWNIGHIPARSQDLNKVRRNRGFDFFSKIITRKHSFASQMLRVNRKIRGDVIFLSKKKS